MDLSPMRQGADAGRQGPEAEIVRVTILGSGTSSGVPLIGCDCPVCRSEDPRDRRTRCSVLVSTEGGDVLIDTATDLWAQSLALGLRRVDAVLYTHHHADHVHGIDDLRSFNFVMRREIPLYGPAWMMDFLRARYAYLFTDVQAGGGKPQVSLHAVQDEFELCGRTWRMIDVFHGDLKIAAYRVGGFAYLTDVSRIPDESWDLLRGLDVLIVDALRDAPHPTHFNVAQALEAIERLAPRRAFLTHLCHKRGHAELAARLPAGVQPAHDGLVIEIANAE
jgi:phosphoribosyl 1,2-cyclic phosphate phosphodiesterase